MKKLVFATHNKNKLKEVQNLLPQYVIVDLDAIGCHEEIIEDGATLEENALIKARYVRDHYKLSCFADDTGLEVDSLSGAPGVYSARYAGTHGDSEKNMNKLLGALKNKDNRKAQFRTVIALSTDSGELLFEGICPGSITEEKKGNDGFGYDPIFKAQGFDVTFAEMDLESKGKISHRGLAIEKLIHYLSKKDD